MGHWPAIPRAIRSHEPPVLRKTVYQKVYTAKAQSDGSIKREELIVEVPADIQPWEENIYHRLIEKILPLKKDMSLEFYDAAIHGYLHAMTSRVLDERKQKLKNLPQESPDREWHADFAKRDNSTLEACRKQMMDVLTDWDLREAADYLEGYAYGIRCQQREIGWSVSATTETLQIYKAMLENHFAIQSLIKSKKSATEMAKYIAQIATLNDGKTKHAKVFCKTPEGEEKYLKSFQKLCERIEFPLPSPGRPTKKTKTTTPEN